MTKYIKKEGWQVFGELTVEEMVIAVPLRRDVHIESPPVGVKRGHRGDYLVIREIGNNLHSVVLVGRNVFLNSFEKARLWKRLKYKMRTLL